MERTLLGIITLIVESLLRPRRVYEGVVARGFDRVPIDLVIVILSFLVYPLIKSIPYFAAGVSYLPSVMYALLRTLVEGLLVYIVGTLATYLLLRAFNTELTLKRVRTALVWTLPLRVLGGISAEILGSNVPDWYWSLNLPLAVILVVLLSYLPFMVQAIRLLGEALSLRLGYAALLFLLNAGLHELLRVFIRWADVWVSTLTRSVPGLA